MRPARTIAFWLLAAALVVCHVVVIQHSLGARFWEDEAFNLTVPRNLLAGLGYASDGALSGSTITLFDPRISTGPTVLLPVAVALAFGADAVISARMVPLGFWIALVAGLVVLGRRTAGRWAALIAAAVPLAFNGLGSVSPLQGPTDLLGEIPAAALLVWALVVLPRRAWLAGLLVGLAVQAKLIALLALPGFAVALWVLAPGHGWQRIVQTLKRGWLPLVLAGVPTLLVEVAAFLSMGPAQFVEHLRGLVRFVRGGGQHVQPTTVAQKLETLAGAWFLPPWMAVATTVLCAALIIAGLLVVGRRVTDADRHAVMLVAASAVGGLAFVAWWSTAAHTPLWVRHPAAGVLSFFPVIVIGTVWGARVLVSRGGVERVLGAVLVALLSGSLAWSVAGHVQQTTVPRSETLATQRAAVEPIRQWVQQTGTPWLAARPWGAAIAPIVMSGAHVGLWDADAMADVPQLTGARCDTPTLVAGPRYRVCAAP
ncbi:hypothetical protein ACU045_06385 [Microbacterium sp. MAHUQ-60]|uniref:hypothetical protein n=1 Tax=unclassified Microbacterium TaxID=2609290 RepID=UPI0036171649